MAEKKQRGSSLLKSVSLLMVGTIASKILGFVRELIVAYRYGPGVISDAFVLTNGVADILFCAIGVAIGVNFIPCYTKLEDREKKDLFTSDLIGLIVVILLIGSVLTLLFPKIVLAAFASGLEGAAAQTSIVMLRIAIFSSIPIMLASLFQAYCQANGEFLTTAIYGSLINCIIIGFILISNERTFYLLSVGTLVGNLVGMLVPLVGMKRIGFRYTPVCTIRNDAVKQMALLTLPLLIENIASNLSLLVDRNVASYLDAGTITGLSYAGNITNIASTMIPTAIITATFPLFSKMIAAGEKERFHAQFEKYATVISFLLAPISVFMMLNATDIVTFIFEHGAFRSTGTKIVAECMICYAAGILPMGLQSYLIRAFYSMQDTKTPVKIKVFALICNIVMNLILVLFIGHMGIALSTSVSYLIAYALLAFDLRKKHGVEGLGRITREGGAALLLSVLPGAAVFFAFRFLLPIPNLFLKLLAEGVLFAGLYLVLMLVFRKDRLADVLHALKR